jgi:hypothetical protein
MMSYVGAPYQAMGELSLQNPGFEVFTGHHRTPGTMAALDQFGAPLPGWPWVQPNYVSNPASVVDIDGDGIAEVFICQEDHQVHAYRADGTVLPGWPVHWLNSGQSCFTPAVADLDGDGTMEIVTATESSTAGTLLIALHRDGTPVSGFPIRIPITYVQTYPVIGDVDGDGRREIVMVSNLSGRARVHIYSGSGVEERIIEAKGTTSYGSAPALADLDGDGVPEILLESDGRLEVWRGDGSIFPGWPQIWSAQGQGEWIGNSSPVVGDVDGDQEPDIVVESYIPDG